MKTVRLVLAVLALTLIAPWQSAKATDVICYNCPPEWADWASMLKAIKADLNYDIPHDNKNSGQALAQILTEKSNPVADIGYFGVTFGMKAKAQDALEPYKPAHWDQVPAGLKDPDGYWTTIHSGTLGLFVNKDALGGKPVPACWKDLLKPDYKGMVGYLDPSSAAVGYVGAVAINLALGGSPANFDPAISFFKELRKNDPIVPKQTAYARVVSGEMPILFDYDQRLPREIFGKRQLRVCDPLRGIGGVSLCRRSGEERAGQGQGQEGDGLSSVRQGAGDLDQCLFASGPSDRVAGRGEGQIPPGQRLCPRQERRLG
ncbi:hypothetical protein CI41S_56720 [Bradyrhizobium ivorense]|nr:hypothetical protein CI41S_56720 [Bradyrhizobium ivorense]